MKLIWFGLPSVQPVFSSQEDQLCFSSVSNSLNSSTTHLGGKMWRKPPWTWTCSWGGLMKFSFGWSQRCVCVLNSARGCSFSRSSSRLPPSKRTLFHCLLCSLFSLPQFAVLFSNFPFPVFCQSCKEYRNLNAFFAIIMGLSNPAVCRLSQTWEVGTCPQSKLFLF